MGLPGEEDGKSRGHMTEGRDLDVGLLEGLDCVLLDLFPLTPVLRRGYGPHRPKALETLHPGSP